jgi:hypothetical protein
MPDVLAEVARERGAFFVGKIELHLDKVPWVRTDFNTTSDRQFQSREVIWSRSTPRACKREIMDLLRKSGEFPTSYEELDDTAATVYDGV